ncbi:hypothetical protein [Kitasatospora cineracea]|uniref:hypothetical protein n=1 Tax=Kitasatospora cineracea TaxID=88074 RepID=UPI00367EEF56
MYEKVERIAEGQTRMEGKLDRVLADQVEQREATADHERRLRALEARVWMAMGAAVVLGAGSGAGLAQIMGRRSSSVVTAGMAGMVT